MVRFLVSILLGAAVTFVLFSFMAFLVSSGDRNKEEPLENIIVEGKTSLYKGVGAMPKDSNHIRSISLGSDNK